MAKSSIWTNFNDYQAAYDAKWKNYKNASGGSSYTPTNEAEWKNAIAQEGGREITALEAYAPNKQTLSANFTPAAGNAGAVQTSVRNLLGRDPTQDEITTWSDYLATGNSFDRMKSAIMKTPEYVAYQEAGNTPTPGADFANYAPNTQINYDAGRGATSLTSTGKTIPGEKYLAEQQAIKNGTATQAGTTQQFTAPALTGNDGQVQQIYRQLLGREPDAGGLQTWSAYLTSGHTLDQLKAEIAKSPEYQQYQQKQGTAGTQTAAVGADGKPIETAPNGQPTAAQGLGGNTLDEIQASPIPPLPAGYGAGSGLSQVDWALQHRQNIFNAYQKYGITPTAEEVNWWLQKESNINNIDSEIAKAVSSGSDTRGHMPAGSAVTSEAQSKADNTVTNITSTDANGQDKPLSQVVQEFTDSLGLTEISKQIQAVTDAEGEAEMAINENPWLSEAERSKRVQLSASKFEAKKNALIDRLKLQEDAVAKAVDYYEKDREYKKDILFKQLDLQSKELDRQLAIEKEEMAMAQKKDERANALLSISDAKALGVPYGTTVAQASQMGITPRYVGGGGGGGGKTTPIEEGGLPAGWENNGDVLRQLITEDITAGGTREQLLQLYQEKGANMDLVTALLDELLPKEEGYNGQSKDWGIIGQIGDWLDSYKDKVRASKGFPTIAEIKAGKTNKTGSW